MVKHLGDVLYARLRGDQGPRARSNSTRRRTMPARRHGRTDFALFLPPPPRARIDGVLVAPVPPSVSVVAREPGSRRVVKVG